MQENNPLDQAADSDLAQSDSAVDEKKELLGIGSIVTHPTFGRGRIIGYQNDAYAIQFRGGDVHIVASYYSELKTVETDGDADLDRIKQAMREVLGDYGWLDTELELNKRWKGGTLEMIPGTTGVQSKSLPIEAFFKKIIGIREKLRVMEQKINNHPDLSQEQKVELEAYITRCYGSLTSFNVLFADKQSAFKGMGKGGDA